LIISIQADQDNLGNLITFLLSRTLKDDDPRRNLIMPDISKQTVLDWTKELINLNKSNKEFMDVVLQI